VARVLGLTAREDVLVRRRVLYANEEPTQIADSHYSWSIAKLSTELLEPDSGQGGSYGRLADLGYGPVRFSEDVTVCLPSDKEQRVALAFLSSTRLACRISLALDFRPGARTFEE
jgi:GntR family transcriptional regulator